MLNPFLSYRDGEGALLGHLRHLSVSELRTVIRAYDLDSDLQVELDTLSRTDLIDLLVESVVEQPDA